MLDTNDKMPFLEISPQNTALLVIDMSFDFLQLTWAASTRCHVIGSRRRFRTDNSSMLEISTIPHKYKWVPWISGSGRPLVNLAP